MQAVVVGSGPNGLAGAIRLAQAGCAVTVIEAQERVGGGLGSAELTSPGLIHDLGASFMPLGKASPFLRGLQLERHGVRWIEPDVALAHPLDDGSAGLLMRSLDETVVRLGADGARWARLFGTLSRRFDELADDVLQPMLHVPRHPALLGAFGARAARSAVSLARGFRTEQARALFTGIAAHAFTRLDTPFSSAVGVMLTAAGHSVGWPIIQGGAQRLADALAEVLYESGGSIELGRRVHDVREIAEADIVLLDVSARDASAMLAGLQPMRTRQAYRAFRRGPAAFKVDFAIEGDIPWKAEHAWRAGVVHLGGSAAETVRTERRATAGLAANAPFTLVGQQYLSDRSRSAGGRNPIWAYAHVPHGFPGNGVASVTKQIERFAPGFRERIVEAHVTTPAALAAANPNFAGGDINTGANTFRQLIARPLLRSNPYATGVPGVYLCSAATPPGPGVHGMSGSNAAEVALRAL